MTADMSIEMTSGTLAIAIIVGTSVETTDDTSVETTDDTSVETTDDTSVETTDDTSVETTGATANARATTVGRAARRRMHRDA
jgi:hypothetical protein